MEPMNNFTPRAQQVLALARKEADRFYHNYVDIQIQPYIIILKDHACITLLSVVC